LGKNYLNTLLNVVSLAVILLSQSKYEKAEEVSRRILNKNKKNTKKGLSGYVNKYLLSHNNITILKQVRGSRGDILTNFKKKYKKREDVRKKLSKNAVNVVSLAAILLF